MYDGPTETVNTHVGEYLVHAGLDFWILSQNCRNALPWHTVDKLVRSTQNEM